MDNAKPITRLGLLGAGAVAMHHIAAVHAANATIEVACTKRSDSPHWKQLSVLAPGVRKVHNIEDVLDDSNVEGVLVCMSWDAIAPTLSQLLASQKPMLIEKPIAFSLDEIPTGQFDQKMVGYNRRFYHVVDVMKQRLLQGGLKAVDVTISEDVERHIRRHGSSIVPRILEFSSSHTLDLLLYLLGPLKVVKLYRQTNEASEFTSYNGLLVTNESIPVSLALNENDASPTSIRFRFLDHSAWVLSPLEKLSVYQGLNVTELTDDHKVRQYKPRMIDEHYEDASLKPGFLRQMQTFVSGEFTQAASIEDSRRLLKLIQEMRNA